MGWSRERRGVRPSWGQSKVPESIPAVPKFTLALYADPITPDPITPLTRLNESAACVSP